MNIGFLRGFGLVRRVCNTLALVLLFAVACSAQHTPTSGPDSSQHGTLDFVSDTQQPLFLEQLFLKSDGNADATSRIFAAIAADTTALAVYHLGDITGAAQISWLWKTFDEFRSHLRVPLVVALGNHDYFFFRSQAEDVLIEHLGNMPASWALHVYGEVAVITLNSNFGRLTEKERDSQRAWYAATLATLDKDASVKIILVACHHSPMTNSTVVDPSDDVRNEFVGPFLAAPKARVFLSGHAHAYEHFVERGKDFFVIGGGGGLLHPLREGSEKRFTDLAHHENGRSYFHYAVCAWSGNELRLHIWMLQSDGPGFVTADSLVIPMNR